MKTNNNNLLTGTNNIAFTHENYTAQNNQRNLNKFFTCQTIEI